MKKAIYLLLGILLVLVYSCYNENDACILGLDDFEMPKSEDCSVWFSGDLSEKLELSSYKLSSMSSDDLKTLGLAMCRLGVYSDSKGLYHIKASSGEVANISDSLYVFIESELNRTNNNLYGYLTNTIHSPLFRIAGLENTGHKPDCVVWSIMHAPGNSRSYDQVLNYCINHSGIGYNWVSAGGFNTSIVVDVLSDCGLSFTEYTPSGFLTQINFSSRIFDGEPIAIQNGAHMVNLVAFTYLGAPNLLGTIIYNDYQSGDSYLIIPFDSNIWRIWANSI